MNNKLGYHDKELYKLERMRRNLGRKLDAVYGKDDVVGAITLETKYQQIAHRIEQIRSILKTRRALT